MDLAIKDDGWRLPDAIWKQMEPLLSPRKAHRLICIDLSSSSIKIPVFVQRVGSRTGGMPTVISLICAGWLPHDNRFVGELPRSRVEDHSIAGCLIAVPRILPPLPILLPTRWTLMIILPYALAATGATAWPMAQMKPANSRATAVQACTFSLPLPSISR